MIYHYIETDIGKYENLLSYAIYLRDNAIIGLALSDDNELTKNNTMRLELEAIKRVIYHVFVSKKLNVPHGLYIRSDGIYGKYKLLDEIYNYIKHVIKRIADIDYRLYKNNFRRYIRLTVASSRTQHNADALNILSRIALINNNNINLEPTEINGNRYTFKDGAIVKLSPMPEFKHRDRVLFHSCSMCHSNTPCIHVISAIQNSNMWYKGILDIKKDDLPVLTDKHIYNFSRYKEFVFDIA